MTQIITDIGIIECPMGYKTTKKCHSGNVPCIGSLELSIDTCPNLHLCRNVKEEMGIVRDEEHKRKEEEHE